MRPEAQLSDPIHWSHPTGSSTLEAQLSDPIHWHTSLYDKVFWEDIRHACAIFPELWILGGKLSPNPRVMEGPET